MCIRDRPYRKRRIRLCVIGFNYNFCTCISTFFHEMCIRDRLSEQCCLFAAIPSNIKEKEKEKAVKSVGFIAHMDTTPDASGTNVKPWVLENYDGGDVLLNKGRNIIPVSYTHLQSR